MRRLVVRHKADCLLFKIFV